MYLTVLDQFFVHEPSTYRHSSTSTSRVQKVSRESTPKLVLKLYLNASTEYEYSSPSAYLFLLCMHLPSLAKTNHNFQRWSPRGRSWPRGQILKSLALASRPQVLENWPVLGSRTAEFFELLKFCGALEKFFGKRFFVKIA